jgi:hypothetical protein
MSSGNQAGLKLNVAHHFLFYVDDFIILQGSVHNIKKCVEHLVISSDKTERE